MAVTASYPRLALAIAAICVAAIYAAIWFVPFASDEAAVRMPKPGDRIMAEFVFPPKWTAGKVNDLLLRYRFADSPSGEDALSASLVPADQLPRVTIEYFRGAERIGVDERPAWCTRFC